MAITLKADPAKGWETLNLFGVDKSLIEQAKAKGISVVTTSPGIYTIKNKVKVFANVSVKTTVITLMQNKSLGPGSVEQYRYTFEQGLKKAIEGTPDASALAAVLAPAKGPLAGIDPDDMKLKSAAWPTLDGTPKAKAAPEVKPAVADSPALGAVAGKVKLVAATALYQPVAGTSPTSTYYTFAFFPGLKLAARVQGTKLSVRAEGDKLAEYKPLLKSQFKIEEDPKGDHASSHYIVSEGKDLILKTLAAIIGVIGYEKVEKVADLNKFVAVFQ
jgi:hypothetical protein